jgi:hypothetical protein
MDSKLYKIMKSRQKELLHLKQDLMETPPNQRTMVWQTNFQCVLNDLEDIEDYLTLYDRQCTCQTKGCLCSANCMPKFF